MSELLVEGTEYERTMTAVGALISYGEGDTETLARYPQLFSASYLTFGVLGLTGGYLFALQDPAEALGELRVQFGGGAGTPYLQILQRLHHDRSHRVIPTDQALGEAEWIALVAIAYSCALMVAFEGGTTVDELLVYTREGLLKHSIGSE